VADGDVSVRFTPDLPTDRLVFRLWPNAPFTAAAGIRLDTGPVTLGDSPATATQPDPTTLVVLPAQPLAAGSAVEVRMTWRLTLAGPVEDRISLGGDSVRMGSFIPLLAWEPGYGWAIDPPVRIQGETASSPAADFETTITAPEGYGILATGGPTGPGRWVAEAVPDVGVSIGHFAVAEATADGGRAEPVRITVGVSAGITDSPSVYADQIARSVADLARRFGAYPWPVYTVAVTPELRGGVEYPMHVMQGPRTLGRTISHEVGHQWFYALVINNQGRDPWLDEGLATWAEARVDGTLPTLVGRSMPADARGRMGAPMSYWEAHESSYWRGAYVQGTQALAALGPPATVDCALAVYVAANAYRVARPADLLRALTSVFPNAPAVFARFGVTG
jgi:hypothetical protein